MFATVVALAAIGCDKPQVVEEPITVLKGKLTKGGQPLAVDPSMTGYAFVEVLFIPPGGKEARFSEKVGTDGSFTVTTDDGKPPAPGKYRVAVRQWEPYPGNDKLQGKYDETKTPIVHEITNPPKEIVIDMDKPTG